MKKVFVILSIVLILIFSTVPCFAQQDPIFYYNNIAGLRSSYEWNGFTVTNNGDSISVSGTAEAVFSGYLSLSTGFSLKRDGRRYAILFNPIDYAVAVSGYGSFSNQSFIFSTVASGDWHTAISFDIRTYPTINLDNFYFYVIDLSLVYDDWQNVDIYTVVSDFSFLLNGYVPKVGNNLYRTSLFNPFVDFYHNIILHSFEYFGDIINKYSFPLFFGTICFSLCLVTFIIVCIFRRCRNI